MFHFVLGHELNLLGLKKRTNVIFIDLFFCLKKAQNVNEQAIEIEIT